MALFSDKGPAGLRSLSLHFARKKTGTKKAKTRYQKGPQLVCLPTKNAKQTHNTRSVFLWCFSATAKKGIKGTNNHATHMRKKGNIFLQIVFSAFG